MLVGAETELAHTIIEGASAHPRDQLPYLVRVKPARAVSI